MSHEKVVLVTGVSSGIGRAVARLLAERGLTVFGTSRRPTEVEPIGGVEVLPLDVRSDESVAACVGEVVERAGRIDVLINSAGFVLGGPLEAATLEEATEQFETNLWGRRETRERRAARDACPQGRADHQRQLARRPGAGPLPGLLLGQQVRAGGGTRRRFATR